MACLYGLLATSIMKLLHIILIFSLLISKISAQKIDKVSTKDLIPIANKFGIDSALYFSGGFPIYMIDTLTAINLLDYVSEYERYSRTESFFSKMAHTGKQKS